MRGRATYARLGSAAGWRTSPFGTKPGAFLGRPDSPSNAPYHQIISVHHLGAAAEPQDQENVRGRSALDLGRVLGVIGDQPAPDLDPVGPAYDHGVAARETTLNLDDARGQQALAAAQRRYGPGVDRQDSSGLQRARDPLLSRCDRICRR